MGLILPDDNKKEEKHESLVKQIQAEYRLAYDYMQPKITEWLVRLKLYNNQRRDKEAVGDTTLFSIHQTVLASLYLDKLSVRFLPREEGDEDTADNLTVMAENDYEEMGKDETDFFWDWDSLFFGRGLLNLSEYIREPENNLYVPVPEVIDPATWLRDPRATSVNGNRMRRGAMRFGGREIKMTRADMEKNPNFFKDIDWDEIKYGTNDTRSLLNDAAQARSDAQGTSHQRNTSEKNLGENAEFTLLEWYTHYSFGGGVKKVKCWLANQRKTLVGMQVQKHDYWQILDRPLYPTSNDWDGTSIPDLTEDKQRGRALAQNLGLSAMKADLHPMYAFNTELIKNRNDLNFGYNKFIPVDGQAANAIVPLQKSFSNMQLLNFVYQTLDMSAQKATASPELKQGVAPQADRTLGESNLVVGESNTRYSLSAKVFGWSEKRFWRQWYQCYKDHFADDIDEKVIRLTGVFSGKWRRIQKKDLVAKIDPDVKVESSVLAKQENAEKRALLTNYFGVALSSEDANRRWGLLKLGELNGLDRDELTFLFPPNVDEREARDENEKLGDNKYVQVLKDQNHITHLIEHNKAPDTPQKLAHIKTHEEALKIKRSNPEFFPADPTQQPLAEPGSAPGQPGAAPTAPGVSQPTQQAPTAPPAPPAVAGTPLRPLQPTGQSYNG